MSGLNLSNWFSFPDGCIFMYYLIFVFRAFCGSKEDQLQHMMIKELSLPLLLVDV